MIKLDKFLKKISDVQNVLEKVQKPKSDFDISASQSLIDKETDDYLKTNEASAQIKLDELKNQIVTEKAKVESDKRAAEEAKEQQRAEVQQQVATQDQSEADAAVQQPQYQQSTVPAQYNYQ